MKRGSDGQFPQRARHVRDGRRGRLGMRWGNRIAKPWFEPKKETRTNPNTHTKTNNMSNKLLFTIVLAAAAAAGCAHQEQQKEEPMKSIVVYYSQTGVTKQVAEIIQEQMGSDIVAVEPVLPYPGTFDSTIAQCQQEMASGTLPELKPIDVDFGQYDVVFVGFPVWFGTYARPMMRFLEGQTLAGKKVVPFATFGSGRGHSDIDLKEALPEAEVLEMFGIRTARIEAAQGEVKQYLLRMGLKEGEAEKVEAYSAQAAVTEEENAIFKAATGDYFMPLGTAQTVGKRAHGEAVDYLFYTVNEMHGTVTNQMILVTAPKEGTPYFTEVLPRE